MNLSVGANRSTSLEFSSHDRPLTPLLSQRSGLLQAAGLPDPARHRAGKLLRCLSQSCHDLLDQDPADPCPGGALWRLERPGRRRPRPARTRLAIEVVLAGYVAALEQGDRPRAEALMAEHLANVQAALRLPALSDPLEQLREALAPLSTSTATDPAPAQAPYLGALL